MTETGPFCAAMRGATCPSCPLNLLGEVGIEATVRPGVTPEQMGEAVKNALADLDGPDGEIADGRAFGRSDDFEDLDWQGAPDEPEEGPTMADTHAIYLNRESEVVRFLGDL